jgi:hypothetical protein
VSGDEDVHARRATDSLDAPAVTVREMLLDHDRRLDAHDILLAEVRGGVKLIKLVLGVSVVGAMGSLWTIWQLLGGRA